MILIKGDCVQFDMAGGGKIIVPERYGIIHDTEGQELDRCDIFIGPFRRTSRRVQMDKRAKDYFGKEYHARGATVDVPKGPWNPVGEVVQIWYRRPASEKPAKYKGVYYHPFYKRMFKRKPVMLSRCGRFYRLELPEGCIANDRGFVFP